MGKEGKVTGRESFIGEIEKAAKSRKI